MQKWGESLFKPTIENESLHQDSNDNGVRIVNFAKSKNLVVKSTMFQHRNIQTHNQIDHILTDWRWNLSILVVRSFRGVNCDNDHYLMVAKVRVTLAVRKQEAQKFDWERFNLRKLNELEGREEYRIKISNTFAVPEILNDNENIHCV
jgi:hypothetical protein